MGGLGIPSARRTITAVLLAACLSLSGGRVAAVPDPSAALSADPDYRRVRELIREREFHASIPLLEGLLIDFADQAEVHSLMGFALRKTGRYDDALTHYLKALSLEADHLGASEYIGELYAETGRLALAEMHLERLRVVCGTDCEETRDLAAAIARAREAKPALPLSSP